MAAVGVLTITGTVAAAAAASAQLNASVVPAQATTVATDCNATIGVTYAANSTGGVHSYTVTPAFAGTGAALTTCQKTPGLVQLAWTTKAGKTVSGWTYFGSGFGTKASTVDGSSKALSLWPSASAALTSKGKTLAFPAITDFNTVTVTITIASTITA